MANVNLISARRAERVRLTRVARGLMLSTVGAGALGVVGIMIFLGQLLVVKSQAGGLEVELGKLRPVLQQIEADEHEKAGLQPKLLTLTEAQKSTKRWYGIMDGLKAVIPEETWLTNLSVDGASDAQRTIKINGVTVNQSRVGETMIRLTAQPDFYKKVDLHFTQIGQQSNGQQDVEFELAAQLNQPELEAKAGGVNATKTN